MDPVLIVLVLVAAALVAGVVWAWRHPSEQTDPVEDEWLDSIK